MEEKLKQLADKLEEKVKKCSDYNDAEFIRGIIYAEFAEMIKEILKNKKSPNSDPRVTININVGALLMMVFFFNILYDSFFYLTTPRYQ